MNRHFIKEYISKLNKEDILMYSQKLGFTLTDDELDTIFFYLKHKQEHFFNEPDIVLYELKEKLNTSTYQKLEELYYKHKSKIF